MFYRNYSILRAKARQENKREQIGKYFSYNKKWTLNINNNKKNKSFLSEIAWNKEKKIRATTTYK